MIKVLLKLLRFALITILAVLVIFVSIQVVYRQLGMTGSFGWTEEASRGLFVWMVMLGAALGVAENTHFAIGALAKKLPGRLKLAKQIMKYSAIGILALIFVYEGWQFVVRGMARVSLVTGLPLAWTFASIFVAGVLMCLFLAGNLLRSTDRPEQPDQEA